MKVVFTRWVFARELMSKIRVLGDLVVGGVLCALVCWLVVMSPL